MRYIVFGLVRVFIRFILLPSEMGLTPARHRAEGAVQQQGGPGGRRLLGGFAF